jgi:hypothetical protein
MRTERRRETAADKLVQRDEAWEALRARLPENLDELARQHGALRRRRKVSTGEQLLRLILVYVTCWLSLRTTAAWAQRALGLALTDSALSYRFDCAVRFLRDLVQRQLPSPRGAPGRGPATARVLLVDGTALTEPGAHSTTWRLHATYSPLDGPVGFELTDEHEGEHLGRAVAHAGDLGIVDMGYGHARDVRLARERDEHCLVRVHPLNLALEDGNGDKLEVQSLRKQANRSVVDRQVRLREPGHPPVEVRLVITRLPKEKAARARQRLRRAASKKGRRTPRALAVQVCGYFFCATTVSAEQVSAAQLLAWYRVRWQVEIDQPWCAPREMVYVPPLPSPVALIRDRLPASDRGTLSPPSGMTTRSGVSAPSHRLRSWPRYGDCGLRAQRVRGAVRSAASRLSSFSSAHTIQTPSGREEDSLRARTQPRRTQLCNVTRDMVS